MLINIQIMLRRVVPGKIVAHAVLSYLPEILRVRKPQSDRSMQSRFDTFVIEILEDISIAFVIGPVSMIGIENSIRQPANITHDGNRAVFQSY